MCSVVTDWLHKKCSFVGYFGSRIVIVPCKQGCCNDAQIQSFLVEKAQKFVSGRGSAQDPAAGAYSAPQIPELGFEEKRQEEGQGRENGEGEQGRKRKGSEEKGPQKK